MTLVGDGGASVSRGLGVEHDADVAWAVGVVSDLVRGYCRLRVTAADGVELVLTGTTSRRLVVGERPLRAVSSVVLDGKLLDVGEYSVLRSGALVRHAGAGWGSADVEVVVVADVGFEAVPRDLRAVVESAAARLAPRRPVGEDEVDLPTVAAAGFTVAELAVLNRYRRRAW